MSNWVVIRNPRIWIYLVVGLVAAGLIGYSEWRNSDAQRLQRCIDASISQMKQETPALAGFDNAQPALVAMARASACGNSASTRRRNRARGSRAEHGDQHGDRQPGPAGPGDGSDSVRRDQPVEVRDESIIRLTV